MFEQNYRESVKKKQTDSEMKINIAKLMKENEINQTSKNVVKYDPLKRIFLERFSYVETELSTKLRSY